MLALLIRVVITKMGYSLSAQSSYEVYEVLLARLAVFMAVTLMITVYGIQRREVGQSVTGFCRNLTAVAFRRLIFLSLNSFRTY
jgi:hypothetical protein